jgi:hypothetical protein
MAGRGTGTVKWEEERGSQERMTWAASAIDGGNPGCASGVHTSCRAHGSHPTPVPTLPRPNPTPTPTPTGCPPHPTLPYPTPPGPHLNSCVSSSGSLTTRFLE